jgi:hypothetical protein
MLLFRYIAVCRPHRYRDLNASMSTLSKVMIYTVPVTTFSFLLNIPKFLETQVTNKTKKIKTEMVVKR